MGNETTKREPLTDQQLAVLEIERQTWVPSSGLPTRGVVSTNERWLYSTGKKSAIRQLLGISEIRYAQILAGLLSNPAAEEYDAQLVRRIRRLRDARATQSGHPRSLPS